MARGIKIGNRWVGDSEPTYIIAEIGINHNGSLDTAQQLIDVAVDAGCDAVKFQKRTPELCVPEAQRNIMRETPWGYISYLDYKKKMEFNRTDFDFINDYCNQVGIDWFASCWDIPSVDFIENFDPVCHKIASASLTDDELLKKINDTGRPMILSTGMSTRKEIYHAVSLLNYDNLVIMHTTSTYPCPNNELNLNMIKTLEEWFPGTPVGYSGHETGLQTTVAAVALGARLIERHITLDRAMWGTDQSASVEPNGLKRLVRDIRVIELALGDGVKKVYDDEIPIIKKLRKQ
jgi:N-acetylneuraminate synthase